MQLRDSGRGYFAAVAQVGGGSSVLNLLCTKDQASENCEHRSGIWQIFRQIVKGIPRHVFSHCFFLPSFSSSLPGLEPHENPRCLASGTNDPQAQDVSLKKKFSERHSDR